MMLSQFKHCLPPRNIIPSVSVEEYQSTKPMFDEVLCQPNQQIQIEARRGGEGPMIVEMVIGVSQPLKRRKQNPISHFLRDSPYYFAQQIAVREQGKVMAVLLECGNREDHRGVGSELLHLGPSQIGQLHSGWGDPTPDIDALSRDTARLLSRRPYRTIGAGMGRYGPRYRAAAGALFP